METRPVKMRVTIEYIENAPEKWTEEQINNYYNHSRWCASNVVPILNELDCLCDFSTFEYVQEATQQDIDNWNEFKVYELEDALSQTLHGQLITLRQRVIELFIELFDLIFNKRQ